VTFGYNQYALKCLCYRSQLQSYGFVYAFDDFWNVSYIDASVSGVGVVERLGNNVFAFAFTGEIGSQCVSKTSWVKTYRLTGSFADNLYRFFNSKHGDSYRATWSMQAIADELFF